MRGVVRGPRVGQLARGVLRTDEELLAGSPTKNSRSQ